MKKSFIGAIIYGVTVFLLFVFLMTTIGAPCPAMGDCSFFYRLSELFSAYNGLYLGAIFIIAMIAAIFGGIVGFLISRLKK